MGSILMARNEPTREAIRLTQLWQKFGPNTYPLELDELVNGLIGSGGFSDALAVHTKSFSSIEGCLVRTIGKKEWTILLNSSGNSRRRRFTFAHELGHFMCHRYLRNNFEDGDETLNDFSDPLELEANTFASWLLMPANLVRQEFGQIRWTTDMLRQMGVRFECSLQASAIRFLELNPAAPIAFVVSRDGIVLWAKKTPACPYISAFRFGDELPTGSQAYEASQIGAVPEAHGRVGMFWNNQSLATETNYLDKSGLGYQYTCLSFDVALGADLVEEPVEDLLDRINSVTYSGR